MTKPAPNSTQLHFVADSHTATTAFTSDLRRDFDVTDSTVVGAGPSYVTVTLQVHDADAIRALAVKHGLSEGTSVRKRSPMPVDDEGSTGQTAREGVSEEGMGKRDRKKTKDKKTKPAATKQPAAKAAKTGAADQSYKAYPRCPKKGCRGWYKNMDDHFRKNPTHNVDETSQETAATPAASAS